uniref:Uncharacterized protein n=1 Tax=Panagrolaimus superbus TaxID=310955 RepID=A0A914Z8G9_9BILA
MLFTLARLHPVVKIPFGKQIWVEKSQVFLPKGGKKLDYGFKFFSGFFIVTGIAAYLYAQADLNPDSIYGRLYKKYITDSLKPVEETDEEKSDPNRFKPLF